MSKIVIAVNSMISNADKISIIKQKDDEYLFLYDNKYKWSIQKKGNDYNLYFYPGNQTIDELAKPEKFASVPFIEYRTEELKTREAEESFKELYLIIKEKLYDVDKALEDIIGQEDSGF